MKFSHVFRIRYGERTKLKLYEIKTYKIFSTRNITKLRYIATCVGPEIHVHVHSCTCNFTTLAKVGARYRTNTKRESFRALFHPLNVYTLSIMHVHVTLRSACIRPMCVCSGEHNERFSHTAASSQPAYNGIICVKAGS